VLDSSEVMQESAYGLSIGTIKFDIGWPWGTKIKVILLFDVKYVKNGKSYDFGLYRVSMGFTLDDLKRLKVKIIILWFEISRKRWQLWGWTQGGLFWKQPMAFDYHSQIWPWMTSRGQNQSHSFWCEICGER